MQRLMCHTHGYPWKGGQPQGFALPFVQLGLQPCKANSSVIFFRLWMALDGFCGIENTLVDELRVE